MVEQEEVDQALSDLLRVAANHLNSIVTRAFKLGREVGLAEARERILKAIGTPVPATADLVTAVAVEKPSRRGRAPLDLTGRRFGILTAVRRSERQTKARQAYWWCRCDCGNEIEARAVALTSGYHLSCGCWRTEATRSRALAQPRDEEGHYLPEPLPEDAPKKWCEWCGEDIPPEKAHKANAKFCSPKCMVAAQNDRNTAKAAQRDSQGPVPDRPFPDLVSLGDAIAFLREQGSEVAERPDGSFGINGLDYDKIGLIRRVNTLRAVKNLQPVSIPL